MHDENKKEWKLSPAYDLTYSSSFNGEHRTTIDSVGKNPNSYDIVVAAKNIGIQEYFNNLYLYFLQTIYHLLKLKGILRRIQK